MAIVLAAFSIICLAIGVGATIHRIRESTDKRTIVENSVLCTIWSIMIIFDIMTILDGLL